MQLEQVRYHVLLVEAWLETVSAFQRRVEGLVMRDSGALSAHIDTELAVFHRQLRNPEAQEAFAAFAEKRPPDFQQFT